MRLWIFVIFAPRGPQRNRSWRSKIQKITKNKFLIKFSSREKIYKKILTGRKNVIFNVWNDSWMIHFKSIFLEIYGQDAGCRLVYIFVNLRLSLGRERKRFNQGFYKNVHFKNVHLQKHTFTRTYIIKTYIAKMYKNNYWKEKLQFLSCGSIIGYIRLFF